MRSMPSLLQALRQAFGMLSESLPVTLAGNLRIDIQLPAAFDVMKQGRFLKRKIDFGRIENRASPPLRGRASGR